jgi:hypothetical protein
LGGCGQCGSEFCPSRLAIFWGGTETSSCLPAFRASRVESRESRFESRDSRVEIRESCQQLRVSFKQHPLLHSSIRITLDHDLYSSREVRLLYSPHPPKTRHFSTPLTPTTHTAHRLQISSFSTPIGPDNALAILHASRALAVQGPLGAVGPA